jgi:hypothetical protein
MLEFLQDNSHWIVLGAMIAFVVFKRKGYGCCAVVRERVKSGVKSGVDNEHRNHRGGCCG